MNIHFTRRLTQIRRLVCRAIDWRYPGARTSGVSRTRVIDDWLVDHIRTGAEQILILGAGYDARAYRLPEVSRFVIFELDRAEVITAKARVVSDTYPNAAVDTRPIAVDFFNDDIGDRLIRSGFDTNKRTVVLWEGVTNYLDAKSVSKTAVWALHRSTTTRSLLHSSRPTARMRVIRRVRVSASR